MDTVQAQNRAEHLDLIEQEKAYDKVKVKEQEREGELRKKRLSRRSRYVSNSNGKKKKPLKNTILMIWGFRRIRYREIN